MLKKILLFLAIALPLVALSNLLIDLHSQSKALLDGPLATPFNKAHAVRELGTAFFISAFVLLLISNIIQFSKINYSSKLSVYLNLSAALLAISVIMFLFLPYFEMGFVLEFYFPDLSRSLSTIQYVVSDLTLAISAIFIAKKIREVS